jgi:Fe-S cluster assembly protein SufD
MSLQAPVAALDAAGIARISDHHGEPDWLRALRASWWERAEATPWPTGQEEEWRRTSLDKLPRDLELLDNAGGAHCALEDEYAAAGVIFSDLRTALSEHPDLVRRYLGAEGSLDSHAYFWALAQAAWTGGLFLYVPAGVEIDRTLVSRSALARAEVAYFPLTLVVAERDSSVTLLDEVVSPDGGAGWFGGIVEVHALDGARVRYANLQRLGDGTWNIGAQRVVVGQDANVTTLNAEVGSRVTKVGLDVQMAGKGGTSRLLGILAAGEDQQIDINSLQNLSASHTTSDLLYLSALYDRAKASFYGVIKIQPEARATSSYQECRNLLLSTDAGASPIPVLEIMNNDIIRCGHGATAGAIDPVMMFYAQSRGLDPDDAERMIVRGFFEQVVSKIEDETIRERVLEALVARIGSSELLVGEAA